MSSATTNSKREPLQMNNAAAVSNHATADDSFRLGRLNSMRSVATGLLVAMAALFVLAKIQHGGHPAWDYLAAFSEAAMVGALADWFAVVALFRHPLGIPIWHTAIIPNSKDDIAKNLGEFVETHFVTVDAIVTRVRDFDPALQAATWLSQPKSAQKVGGLVADAARTLLANFDDAELRLRISQKATTYLSQVELSPILGRLADELHTEGRHQELFDYAVTEAITWLESEGSKEKLTNMLDAVDHKLVQWLSGSVSGVVRSGCLKAFRAAQAEKDHPLRLRYEKAVSDWLDQLKSDPSWKIRIKELQLSLLEGDRVNSMVDSLWDDLRVTLIDDLDRREPKLAELVSNGVTAMATKVKGDVKTRNWLNESLCGALAPLIVSNRGKVAAFIKVQIDAWSKSEMTERLELAVGRDLQFIRINGTLVGGLAGLIIYTLGRSIF